MEIEEGLQRNKQKEEWKSSNIIKNLVEMLTNTIATNNLKEKVQEKYSNILASSETIDYNVLSKVVGKDYTILSFSDEGEKWIKIPNILLPEGTNRRTILNYINGEFKINVEQTEKNNEQWKKQQEGEEILKEDRKYKVTWLANDFTEVIAEDTKETYRFNFMQEYIPFNLQQQLKEGDYIIAKDGRFEKVGEAVKESKIEDTYFGEVKEYTGEKDKIYLVTDIQSQVIKIRDIESEKEQFIKKEGIELEKGDFIKTLPQGYEKYEGSIHINNKKIKEEIKNLYDNIF